MKTDGLYKYFLAFISFIVYPLADVFAKIASFQTNNLMRLFYLVLELVVLAVYGIVWQQVLKHFQLSKIVSSKGILIIIALLYSVLFFDESITIWNILGSSIIVCGVFVVGCDG